MSTTNQKEITKPRTLDVLGGLLLMVALPPLTYYMWLCVNNFGGALVAPTVNLLLRIPAPTVTSVVLYGCWFLLQVILQIVAPGKVHEGVPLSEATCLRSGRSGVAASRFCRACL